MGAPSKVRPAVDNPWQAPATRRNDDGRLFTAKNDVHIWLRIAGTKRVKGAATPGKERSTAKSRFGRGLSKQNREHHYRINLHMENEQR
jgi:hypothetical protein